MKRYTIGRLASEADVPVSTVRYYERRGLVRPSGRTEGNYRVYEEGALELVRFIRVAQANGFTLDDITRLLQLRNGDVIPCAGVQELIEHRLTDVRKRLDELQHIEAVLESSLKQCRKSAPKGRCQVIGALDRKAVRAPGESPRDTPPPAVVPKGF